MAALERVRGRADGGPRAAAHAVWNWLVAAEHRPLLALWFEAYGRSVAEPAGPWAGFAAQTVRDWLTVLEEVAPAMDDAERTLLLTVLRGGMLDLAATGEAERVSAAVRRHLDALPG